MENERFQKQLDFILEIDKEKNMLYQFKPTDNDYLRPYLDVSQAVGCLFDIYTNKNNYLDFII